MFSFNKPAITEKKLKQKILFMMGGPGSGKGTHCKSIAEKNHYHHISTGDLLRNKLKDTSNPEDETIKKIHATIQRGDFLDDKLIMDLITEEMQKHTSAPGFLIDGYPRTQSQLELFEKNVGPCDKILYFKVSEEIMQERMLARGLKEHREDDNEFTIARRIKIYNEQTLPVIHYLRQHHNNIFFQIDTNGEIEEVDKSVSAALTTPGLTQVNFLEFMSLYLRSGNFYDTVTELEKKYNAIDFKIAFYFTVFDIIQNKEDVKTILKANTTSTYQNHNFDVSHGHDLNINATQAFLNNKSMEKNPMWQNIHSALAQSAGDSELIKTLIAKHIPLLFSRPTFQLDEVFEEFLLNFWCEYMFGPKINAAEFIETRRKLLATLRYTFYDSRLRNVPYVGTQACRFYHYLKKDEYTQIDKELLRFVEQSDSGLMKRFKEKLETSADFPADKVDQAVIDNTFIMVLVFDFISNAMYETLVTILKNELDDTVDRKQAYTEGLHTAFLFPFRARTAQQDITLSSATIEKGTSVYINLLKSGLYHSFGPRSCVGVGITNWIKDAIWKNLEDTQLRIIKTTHPEDRKNLSYSKDVPISPERYEVKWQYKRDYLQKLLPHHSFNNVSQFYDILKIYENPVLTGYIAAKMIEKIEKLNLNTKDLSIAAPELRGVPAATLVAQYFRVPLVILRKPGKIPGDIASKSYSTGYSSDTLEMSLTSQVKDKNVILIDDGIASGGTTLTCCDLIEQGGGIVKSILGIIDHVDRQKPEALKKYSVETLFDFKKPTIAEPEGARMKI